VGGKWWGAAGRSCGARVSASSPRAAAGNQTEKEVTMSSTRRLGAAITAGLAAKGIVLYTALIANQLAPEEFVSGYVAEIERTLERAGYHKK
jgi:hypothetical protein